MTIGQHELVLEEPDLVVLQVGGDSSMEETAAMLARVEAFARGRPRLFWLVDVTRAGSIDGAQRRLFAERMRPLPLCGTAFVGASYRLRVLSTLLVTAVRLMGKSDSPAVYVDSEEERRAWIEARRRTLGAAPAG